MRRRVRSFIDLISDLPTLGDGLNFHARSPFAALVPQRHENRPDTVVGRLHYSLSSTLSAHFRWSFGASERS
jgi:hypothetical protein